MAKLTKADLKLEIARSAATSLKEARELMETILDSIVRALRRGERVEVRGFGSFSTHLRRPRQGRNPLTGDRVDVPAKRVLKFRPGRELTDLINGSGGSESGESPNV